MTGHKLADSMAYPPRAMRAEQAAAYLSMSRSMFLQLVDDGVMPQPTKIRDMTTWDRLEIDAAYDDLKQRRENTVHRILRERGNAERKGSKQVPLRPEDGQG